MTNSVLKDLGGNVVAITVPASGGDDTANIAAAIAAAAAAPYYDTIEILLPSANYSTTGFTFGTHTKMVCRGNIKLASGAGPIITIPDNASIQTGQASYLRGVNLIGNNVNGASGPSTTDIGMKIGNNAPFSMDDVTVTACWTGFFFYGTQFAKFKNLKAWQCGVSYFLSPQGPGIGGLNSNSFYDCMSVNAFVHMIVIGNGGFTPNTNLFHNFNTEGSYCGGIHLFANGTNPGPQINFFGLNTENTSANAFNANPYSYVAPQALGVFVCGQYPLYLSGSVVSAVDVFNEDATLPAHSTWARCEANSHLSLTRPSAFGISYGLYVSCDDTSSCDVNTIGNGLLGSIGGITSFTGGLMGSSAYQMALVIPTNTYPDATIPNDFVQPSTAKADGIKGSGTTGAPVFSTDDTYGRIVTLACSANGNSGHINIPVMYPPSGANRVCVAYNIMSTIDLTGACALDIGVAPNVNSSLIDLVAGKWRRVVQVFDTSVNGAQNLDLYIINNAPAAFNISMQNFHMFSGPATDVVHNSRIAKVLAGAYNSKQANAAIVLTGLCASN